MADQANEGVLSPFLRNRRIAAAAVHLRGTVLDVGCGNGGLARHVPPERYLGLDVDPVSVAAAQAACPDHRFVVGDVPDGGVYDTIVALAVIEHVPDPASFLRRLSQFMRDEASARIVCTTPHPSMETLYNAGARIGLFSQSAQEEHETLLDRDALSRAAGGADLRMVDYRRFLFGANQIALFAA
jgi:2-polyprenyl-3-methyl-5-hydroxy-6-metoxy-1,4-benzoquinol methylase